MANVKISNLPVATAIDGTEKVPIVQGSSTKRATVADLLVSTKYDSYRFLYGMNNAAFRKWRKAFANQRAGLALATILSIGDSTTSGNPNLGSNFWANSWPGRLRSYFQALTGIDTGTGWLQPDLAIDSFGGSAPATPNLAVSRSGTWGNFTSIGFADTYASQTGGSTTTYTWTGSKKLRVTTYTGFVSSFGTAHTSTIDGVAASTVLNNSPQRVIHTDFVPIGSGSHTVVLTVTAGSYLAIIGAELRPPSDVSAGVVVHNGGKQSQTSEYFANSSDVFQVNSPISQIKEMAPDLTLILLGTNDMSLPVSVAQYTTNIQALITAAEISGDVLLMTPPRDNSGVTNNAAAFWDALYSLSDINGVPVLDLRHRYNTGAALNLSTDYMDSVGHWTDPGVRDVAAAIESILQIT